MYHITKDYIRKGNSRSGQRINKVRFIVSHDTGNPGSTAYNNQRYFNNSQPSASAHTFIDDKYILEIIPLTEKAWHVQYNKPRDNQLFGADANDAAIGVELCHGGKINFNEAYKRYVWYHAYLCKKFNLQPQKHIVAHKTLDPQRRSDPESALNRYGVTWSKFINDVEKEFNNDGKKELIGKKEEDDVLDKAILIGGFPDFAVAEVLAARIKAPIYTRAAYPGGKVTKELYVVGGSTAGLQADKVINLSGEDRFAVAEAVNKFLG
ncbi:N-acetylmuramoyl-L-alanine amidase [Bacillus sp. HNG]|nr:N-acetylmuramoyl-L-alanine amidase [Bacillus sp. HNG]